MTFSQTDRITDLKPRLLAFMEDHVIPAEPAYSHHVATAPDRWSIPPVMAALKERARTEGLWNLWCPYPEFGAGLNNLDYAPLAEIMGRSLIGPEVFNCNAPDTGNMEVFIKYATKAQQEQWLTPLLAGDIRSAFCMTEPAVASSDATNVEASILRDGDDYVVNGRKWWSSGANDPRCKILIVMGKSDTTAERHKQQSMILVPIDTPGVTVVRPLSVFGADDAPHGHAEIIFDNVRVPAQNILLGEGRGFEIAQGRLGPGRIHHCMRLIGGAQRALEMMCARATSRAAFGKPLSDQGVVRQQIALSACEIEQGRLLAMAAADKMDRMGNKDARDLIGMAKIVIPQMTQNVIDRAIQVHGAAGVSQDTVLAGQFAYARTIRIADGPDEVHQDALARQMLKRFATK
ncbi:acyl-CoA dehydrogenase family protein [Rhodobacteraceae bacterium KMM 6894]|nr:acyl-CoA dehydrogenase family protein [Rhodobacteraceae bacterium KMM 6894]